MKERMPIYEYDKGGKPHYYYAFEVKDDKGKRKTVKKRGFTGKTEARNAEAAAKTEWLKGSYIDPSKITFGEYIQEWLDNKQDISPETRYTNNGHIRNHIIPELGHIPLQKVNVMHIEKFVKYLQERGLADGTVRKIYNLIHTCFKTAVRKEFIIKNPFDLMDKGSKPRESKPKVDYWTTEEVKNFFSVLDHRLRILYVLAIYTGMRRGELLGLRWKDVYFETSQLRISQTLKARQGIKDGVKTDSGYRTITVAPTVMTELKKHRTVSVQEKLAAEKYEDHDLVICQRNGRPLSLGSFDRNWKRLLEKIGMRKIRFHDMRHTCASLLFSANVHPKVVQEQLGHSSIKITLDRYSHMMPNMQSEAAKALERILN
jgi:integrase